MSHVDTRLNADERAALLAEIKVQLPAFLGGASSERVEVLSDVEALLNLRAGDLRKVVAAHLGLSDEVRSLVAELPQGLRRPVTEVVSASFRGQAIRGPIDWGSTIRMRAEGGLPQEFVMRTPRRIFDTPENRALSYLLDRLERELRRVGPARGDHDSGLHNGDWLNEISWSAARIRAARRHHWLRDVPATKPTAQGRERLRAARSRFYARRLPAGLAALSKYVESPTPTAITELLSQRYFEPERDWQLFELVVALRLADAFESQSAAKRKGRMMTGVGRSPYARYAMPDDAEVRLWYQTWPTDIDDSAQMDAVTKYSIPNASPARPDLVAQLRRGGATVDSVILEVKASRRGGYLGAGLMQILGYLKDRPAGFTKPGSGWLVAPPSEAFNSVDFGESDLWAVDSDEVARSLLARFGYQPDSP